MKLSITEDIPRLYDIITTRFNPINESYQGKFLAKQQLNAFVRRLQKNDNDKQLVENLFKHLLSLPQEIIADKLINSYPISQLIAMSTESASFFIDEVFSLPKDKLHHIIQHATPSLFCFDALKDTKEIIGKFFDKLFQLPLKILQTFLEKQADDVFFQLIIRKSGSPEKLLQLPVETAQNFLSKLLNDKKKNAWVVDFLKIPEEILHRLMIENFDRFAQAMYHKEIFEAICTLPEENLKLLLSPYIEVISRDSYLLSRFLKLSFECICNILFPDEHDLNRQKSLLAEYVQEKTLIAKKGFCKGKKYLKDKEILAALLRNSQDPVKFLEELWEYKYKEQEAIEELQSKILNSDVSKRINSALHDYKFNNSYKFLMQFTTPASYYVDNLDSPNLIVGQLLRSIYHNLGKDENERKSNSIKLAEELNKLINEHPFIAQILGKSSEKESSIYIIKGEYLPNESKIRGLCYSDTLEIAVAFNDMEKALATLVHECTHKLIEMLYDNNGLPYVKGEEFDISQHMQAEIELCKKLFWPKNWLSSMLENYIEEKYPVEIFPQFTEAITYKILNGSNFASISEDFANMLWDLLHKQLKLGEQSQLPREAYYNIAPEELALTKQISDEDYSWLKIDTNYYLFNKLKQCIKFSFFNNLFQLPIEEMIPILTEYTDKLISSSRLNFDLFTNSLIGLSDDVLYTVAKKVIIPITKWSNIDKKKKILSALLKKSDKEFYDIIPNDTLLEQLLQVCSQQEVCENDLRILISDVEARYNNILVDTEIWKLLGGE